MELEEAIKTLNAYINAIDTFGTIDPRCCNNLYESARTILQELDRLQKENGLAKKALIANSYEADERNDLLAEVQRLKKENEKLKEIDLTTVHIKGVCDERERWKNKIREKIEECKKFIMDDENFSPLHQNDKELLEELLKEE